MSASLTLFPLLQSPSEKNSELRETSAFPQNYAVEFPNLRSGQFAVFSTEISDGAPEASNYQDSEDGDAQVWIFDSFEDARACAVEFVVANPFRQCAIFDANRRHVHTLRNGQPIPLEVLLARQPKSPRGWWQLWK